MHSVTALKSLALCCLGHPIKLPILHYKQRTAHLLCSHLALDCWGGGQCLLILDELLLRHSSARLLAPLRLLI